MGGDDFRAELLRASQIGAQQHPPAFRQRGAIGHAHAKPHSIPDEAQQSLAGRRCCDEFRHDFEAAEKIPDRVLECNAGLAILQITAMKSSNGNREFEVIPYPITASRVPWNFSLPKSAKW